ncbi:MAG: DMT family transporter, partial [Candidatus Rokubacteria bacterium]|nr:DMT family transporter [Candidatus Rokubacteria bacterium]
MSEPGTRRRIDATGAALSLLVSVLWGANPAAIKLGLLDAPPIRLAGLRFLVGGAVILGWAWLTGRLRGLRVARREWRPLLVVTAIFIGQIATMNVGTAMTSAAHSAILLNLSAVHTVVLAHFLIPGDRLSARKMLGVGVSYAGSGALRAAGPGRPRHAGRRRPHVPERAPARRSHGLPRARGAHPRPGEAPARPGHARRRRLLRLLRGDGARRGHVDSPPGPVHRLPGRGGGGLQLRDQSLAAPTLSPERARSAVPHP